MNNLRKILNSKALTQTNKYGLYIHEYQAYEVLKKYGLPMVPVSLLFLLRVLEPPLQKMHTQSLKD